VSGWQEGKERGQEKLQEKKELLERNPVSLENKPSLSLLENF